MKLIGAFINPITINYDLDLTNKCNLCYKKLGMRIIIPNEDNTLQEIFINLYHPYCRALQRRKERLKKELLDTEFLIFTQKHEFSYMDKNI